MDPISAFCFAASIVNFVDFGGKLLSGTSEVYHSLSGQTMRHIELSQLVIDLSSMSADVHEKLKHFQESNKSMCATDKTMERLCRECRTIANELNAALQKLKAQGTTKLDLMRKSISVALKSIWSQDEIEDKVQRLEQIRSQMMVTILVFLWSVVP
jgi:hypothetical protein